MRTEKEGERCVTGHKERGKDFIKMSMISMGIDKLSIQRQENCTDEDIDSVNLQKYP